MFFKTKTCRNKLYIYPEVEIYVKEQSPTELIELGFVVLEISLLLLRMLDAQNYKKAMQFWVERISHNANTLSELLWEGDKQANQLMVRKPNKEQMKLLRYKISITIQTLFSVEEDGRMSYKMDHLHEYLGKRDWIKR